MTTLDPSPLLSRLPLEIRQQIYRQFFIVCRREPITVQDSFTDYANPHLHRFPHDWIRVGPAKSCWVTPEGISSLLRVNHAIRTEAEEILYGRFVLYFDFWWCCPYQIHRFAENISPFAGGQIHHLAIVIRMSEEVYGAYGYDLYKGDVIAGKEGNELLVYYLPNLRTVSFEVQIHGSMFDTKGGLPRFGIRLSHQTIAERCLAVTRPFSRVPGLKLRWAGQHLGAHIAHLCSERSAGDVTWPWTTSDEWIWEDSLKKSQVSLTTAKTIPYIHELHRRLLNEPGRGATTSCVPPKETETSCVEPVGE